MINCSVNTFWAVVFITFTLILVSSMFMENEPNELGEISFECGFEPAFMVRIPFSIHFFSVTVVFLIFDLEVVILVPILFQLFSFSALSYLTLMVWVLFVGLLVEWFDSSLSWQF